jgi:hypothetical protein
MLRPYRSQFDRTTKLTKSKHEVSLTSSGEERGGALVTLAVNHFFSSHLSHSVLIHSFVFPAPEVFFRA